MTDPITKAVEALASCRRIAAYSHAHGLVADIDAAISDLRALQQTHVMVPKEPTQAMIAALVTSADLEQSDPEDHRHDDGCESAQTIYRAMLSAAQQEQQHG